MSAVRCVVSATPWIRNGLTQMPLHHRMGLHHISSCFVCFVLVLCSGQFEMVSRLFLGWLPSVP